MAKTRSARGTVENSFDGGELDSMEEIWELKARVLPGRSIERRHASPIFTIMAALSGSFVLAKGTLRKHVRRSDNGEN